MKSIAIVLLAFTLVQPAFAQDAPEPDASRRVLIISIDGLRPDLLLRADCPNLRSLVERGSYTFWAQTTPQGATLPSHASMVTGRRVEFHGIHWNRDEIPAGVEYRYPQCPTLFDLAKQAELTTALVAGKSKFTALARPGSVDFAFIPPHGATITDRQTADAAVDIINAQRPRVMLLHLPQTDTVGHERGWGSPAQLATIEGADGAVGRVLAALEERGVLDRTLVIVTADHGGFDKRHHGRDPRGLHIPWIAAGPGVRENHDLTLDKDLVVHTEDTFATACKFLGLPLSEACEGKPIDAAFNPAPTPLEPLND